MPKIPTFEARGSIEQLSGTTSNIQLGLNNNLASALAPVTQAVVNHAVKENALQNQAEALRLENKFIVEMNEVQNTINTDERFATNKILANEYLNEKSDFLIKKYRSLATNGNVQDKFSTYGLAETQKAIFRTDSQISKNILLDLNNGYLEAKQNYLNTALTNGEFDAATLTTDLLNLTNNTWKDQISPPLLEKMLNGIPNEIDMYGAVKLIQDDPKTALMQLKDDNFFTNLDVDERLTLQGEAKKLLAPRIDADWKDVLAGATKGKKIEFDMEFAKEVLPPDVIDGMVKQKKIIDVTVDNVALINSMPTSELESSLETFKAEGIALAGEAEGQKIEIIYKNAIVARTAALNKDPVNFLIENNDEIKKGYEDVANITDVLAQSQAKNNLVNLIVQTQKDMGVPNEKIKVMSSSEASNFVANYMKNATGNPANASSLLNSVITNFGENDGQALLELQAAGLPFNAVLAQQGFLTENEKRKAFSFDTAEEKTKLLDFAKRKNEDFDFKNLKIEISNMEGFEELENIVRLNNQFESTDGVGQMDNVVEFLSYYALNEMYTNSKYDQDDAAKSAVNMFIKNFDTTQDTFYVPKKYEGKDLTEFGQTTDGVINKTKLIQEHYLSDFNAVAYKSATGDVDEKELTDKMILNMKVNGEWRNTANGDSLIYGIVLADTSFAPVLNADGNELSFKINDTSDILPGGSNIALDPSKLRIANESDVYAMNKMIKVPNEDLFTSIPDKKKKTKITIDDKNNQSSILKTISNAIIPPAMAGDMIEPKIFNNPGNIEIGEEYAGETGEKYAERFAVFDSKEMGIRALALDLKTKIKRHNGIISEIIKEYAPSSENDTASYIKFVEKKLGKKEITVDDIAELTKAIILRENKKNIANLYLEPSVFDVGIKLSNTFFKKGTTLEEALKQIK
jgi:hypothetical protein